MGLLIFPNGVPKDVIKTQDRDDQGRRTETHRVRSARDGRIEGKLFFPGENDGRNDCTVYPEAIRIPVKASDYGMTVSEMARFLFENEALFPLELPRLRASGLITPGGSAS